MCMVFEEVMAFFLVSKDVPSKYSKKASGFGQSIWLRSSSCGLFTVFVLDFKTETSQSLVLTQIM